MSSEDDSSPAAEEGLVPITLPSPGLFRGELKVTNWLVELGEEFMSGERLVEVISPGVLFVVDAPVEGRLVRIEVPVDGSLTATSTLGWIAPSDDDSHSR